MDTNETKRRTRVRAYPPEFKARLVAEAERPGASVAKVALAHGLNANMLHTWRREVRGTLGPSSSRFRSPARPRRPRRFVSSCATAAPASQCPGRQRRPMHAHAWLRELLR